MRFDRPLRKTAAALLATAALSASAASVRAQNAPAVPARRVVLSVGVREAGRFLGGLTAADFEVLEAGRPRPVVAAFETARGRVVRGDGPADLAPKAGRHIYALFQMTDYDSRLEDALEALFADVATADDTVTLVTPSKAYNMTSQALRARGAEAVAREARRLLRKDILAGGSDYRSLLNDLRRITRGIEGQGLVRPMDDVEAESDQGEADFGIELALPRYKATLAKLESLRLVDERKFLALAEGLGRDPLPTLVFVFYQREFRPEISPVVLSQLLSLYQDRDDILASLSELFQAYRRDLGFDVGPARRAFAASGTLLSFVFMNKVAKPGFGVVMREQSEDLFRIFTGLAAATGGAVDASSHPGAGLRAVAAAADPRYVLVYDGSAEPPAGAFLPLEVRVKGRPSVVTCRAGVVR